MHLGNLHNAAQIKENIHEEPQNYTSFDTQISWHLGSSATNLMQIK